MILGPEHPLHVADNADGLSPRILVRHGLEAELTRPVYYELAELGLATSPPGVWSQGIFFSLEPST